MVRVGLGMAVGLGHSKHVLLCHPKVEKDLILLKATLDVLVKKNHLTNNAMLIPSM